MRTLPYATVGLSLLFAPGCLPTGSHDPSESPDPGEEEECVTHPIDRAPASAEATAAAAGSNALGLDLLRRAGPDAILSPLSVSTALGMLLGGADGATADEIRGVLGATDDATFHAGLAELNDTLRKFSSDGAGDCATWQFQAGNNAFVADRLPLSDEFTALLADPYGVAPVQVDFADATAAADTINAWAGEQTNGRITDLADPAEFSASTVLVLANAVWFYGPWLHAFDAADTQDGPFHRADGTDVQVPLMHGSEDYGFAVVDGGVLVELPYRGEDLRMVLLVPDANDGLDTLLAGFDPASFDRMAPLQLDLVLPRFEAKNRVSLAGSLAALGMPSAFDQLMADLSRIPAPDASVGNLFVDDIVQSAWISVDEAGTEAAAATEVIVSDTASIPEEVRADHPFAYFVRDSVSGVVLFEGRVDDPS